MVLYVARILSVIQYEKMGQCMKIFECKYVRAVPAALSRTLLLVSVIDQHR